VTISGGGADGEATAPSPIGDDETTATNAGAVNQFFSTYC